MRWSKSTLLQSLVLIWLTAVTMKTTPRFTPPSANCPARTWQDQHAKDDADGNESEESEDELEFMDDVQVQDRISHLHSKDGRCSNQEFGLHVFS